MIRIMSVQGDVIVEDHVGKYSTMARSGMELDEGGSYLIATTQNSTAEIMASGRTFKLGQSSFMRISRDRNWVSSHHFSWTRDLKLFVGKIWSHISNDSRNPDEGSGNAVAGVRG